MFDFLKTLRGLLKHKNAQIRKEREMLLAANETNKILSAYILLLASRQKVIKVSKADIAAVLNHYVADVSSDGDNYIVEIKELKENHLGNGECSAVK